MRNLYPHKVQETPESEDGEEVSQTPMSRHGVVTAAMNSLPLGLLVQNQSNQTFQQATLTRFSRLWGEREEGRKGEGTWKDQRDMLEVAQELGED